MTREELKKQCILWDANNIKGFFGRGEEEYMWLSNFHLSPTFVNRRLFPSVEHAYQFAKTLKPEYHEADVMSMTCAEVKKWGGNVKLRPDWEAIKYSVMHTAVMAKFVGDNILRQMLIDTANKYLEETNWWHDMYWGVDYKTGNGLNMLGHCLMSVRKFFIAHKVEII